MLYTQLIHEPTENNIWYDEFITLKIFETKHSEVCVCVYACVYVCIYKNIHIAYKYMHMYFSITWDVI